MKPTLTPSMYDLYGNRKYLTIPERKAFLKVASNASPEVMTFCLVLAYTGARISEVLALTALSFDFSVKGITVESLKKRRRGIYRTIPIPSKLLAILNTVHNIKKKQGDPQVSNERIWSWGRTTGWTRVKEIMAKAGVTGTHATPKGLRHAFGVSGAVELKIPITMIQKWMGHADIATTSIYLRAVGAEERMVAKQFWTGFQLRPYFLTKLRWFNRL